MGTGGVVAEGEEVVATGSAQGLPEGGVKLTGVSVDRGRGGTAGKVVTVLDGRPIKLMNAGGECVSSTEDSRVQPGS